MHFLRFQTVSDRRRPSLRRAWSAPALPLPPYSASRWHVGTETGGSKLAQPPRSGRLEGPISVRHACLEADKAFPPPQGTVLIVGHLART